MLACLNYVADDRQIERGEQVARLVEDEVGSAEICLLAALRDDGEAWLLGGGGGSRGNGAAAEQQAGNVSYQSLSGANEKAILLASSLSKSGVRSCDRVGFLMEFFMNWLPYSLP